MKVDIKGRIKKMKLPKDKSFLPIYESIVNSFQSIEELEDKSNTYIKVKIKRDSSQIAEDEDYKGAMYPIKSFIIEDNGVGFNKSNYNSFNTSDSTYKFQKGGKGIGRFLWLKSFENVYIKSIYEDSGLNKMIEFKFILDDNPIKDVNEIEDIKETRKTIIELDNMKEKYQTKTKQSLNTIGFGIIEHCLPYFLNENQTKVTIEDDFEKIDLNDLFEKNLSISTDKQEFYIEDNKFSITHVKIYNKSNIHRIHFCANHREVKTINLKDIIPDLSCNIREKGLESKFSYSAYISGDLLDENVNDERTDFNISIQDDLLFSSKISMSQIEENTIKLIKEYLHDYIEPIMKEKIENIKRYIITTKPTYRMLLKYKPELVEKIPANIDDDRLNLELFKIQQQLDYELKQEGEKFIKSNKINDIRETKEYEQRFFEYIEKENEVGKSKLAEYITHRKIIIELLDQSLSINENNKYSLEEYVHNLIFPMRKVSDEVSYENHNLWLIDERLSYHYYLASDIRMRDIDVVDADSNSRPDLIIMDKPIVLTNEDTKPYNALTIVEFKRPMRDDYNDNDNPISQVIKYVKEIRNGNKKDRKGRPLTIGDNTAFYLYIIADLTPKLIEQAELANLTKSVDGMGFFGYNGVRGINAYIEIISYEKLLNDANKRNRILFDKLFNSTP